MGLFMANDPHSGTPAQPRFAVSPPAFHQNPAGIRRFAPFAPLARIDLVDEHFHRNSADGPRLWIHARIPGNILNGGPRPGNVFRNTRLKMGVVFARPKNIISPCNGWSSF
jgi:hypothetical protein